MEKENYQRCALHPAAEKFAALSDGRIRVHSTRTEKMEVQFDKDDSQYTCLAWGRRQAPKKGAAKGEQNTPFFLYLAVGTEKGYIVLWDVNLSTIKFQLGKQQATHTQRITALAFNALGTRLYAASADKNISCWDIQTGNFLSMIEGGTQVAPRRLAVSPDSKTLVVANAAKLRTLSLETNTKLNTMEAHSTPVSAIKFLSNSLFVTAAGERSVIVWKLEEATPWQYLNCSHSIYHIDYRVHPSQTGTHQVIGASEKTIYVWEFKADSPASTTHNPVTQFPVESRQTFSDLCFPDPKSVSVLAVQLKGELFNFRRIQLQPQETKTQNKKQEKTNNAQQNGNEMKEDEESEGAEVKPVKPAAPKTKKAKEDSKFIPVGKQESQEAVVLAGWESASRNMFTSNSTQDVEELTLGEQLAFVEAKDHEDTPAPPPANTIDSVLIQALKMDDKDLLGSCLVSYEDHILQHSVQQIPTTYILKFLQEIIDRFYSQPRNGGPLIRWIRALLVAHTSFLMSVPEAVSIITDLYNLIDHRTSSFKNLIRLSGRLDLVLTQRDAQKLSYKKRPRAIYSEGEGPTTYYPATEDEEGEKAQDDEEDAFDEELLEQGLLEEEGLEDEGLPEDDAEEDMPLEDEEEEEAPKSKKPKTR